MAEQTSELMTKVANTARYTGRLAYLAASSAWAVRAESFAIPNHEVRNALAKTVLNNPQAFAASIGVSFSCRPNVLGGGIGFGEDGIPYLLAEDGSLGAQLLADWDIMAGV